VVGSRIHAKYNIPQALLVSTSEMKSSAVLVSTQSVLVLKLPCGQMQSIKDAEREVLVVREAGHLKQ